VDQSEEKLNQVITATVTEGFPNSILVALSP